MNFDPKSEQEIQEANLMPDGEYQAEVIAAFDKDPQGNPLMTRTGSPRIDITLKVYDAEGKVKSLKCTLTPAFPKLLKHFCDVAGLEAEYRKGNLDADTCLQCKGSFVLRVTKRSYIAKDGQEVWVNNVTDFLKSTLSEKAGIAAKKDEFFDDQLPF